MATRILIVGFGNPLAADDGAGPAVVARLLEMNPPAGVRCEDGGSDSLRLPTLWRGEREIWLVDAVARGTPPTSGETTTASRSSVTFRWKYSAIIGPA